MPEPLLYLKATGAAAIASAVIVLAMVGIRRPASGAWINSACVVGSGLGLALGYYLLSLRLAWPPANGLDRFAMIVVPAILAVELIAGVPCVPCWVAWLLRLSLATLVPRILLHGSVYISRSDDGWSPWETIAILAVSSVLLAGLWSLLTWLSVRSPGASIPLTLGMAVQCAGVTVMLAGYIKGGAAAFPLAATIVVTTLVAGPRMKSTAPPSNHSLPALIGIGVFSLFCLLFIGRYFGRLSTGCMVVILLAPLLCWVTELPVLRDRKPWIVGAIRLTLVAIPLVVVLLLAKREFDLKFSPLLGSTSAPMSRICEGG
ncbi:MAG: hypothetical protein H6823_03720 [Planctomycetaceae bacterium]|nr:hypothetical protein [Planctomycetales bacterium]MCB9937324.1 hypothetical protein [Planctomycetaceae bacterium]